MQSACALLGLREFLRHDEKAFSIVNINLFNQRLQPVADGQELGNWVGDWLFRRERLALIDGVLQTLRPDLVVFQQMLAKEGSQSDFDRAILSAGSLDGYEWRVRKTRDYIDMLEVEFQAVALSLPLHFHQDFEGKTVPLGSDGVYTVYEARLDAAPILLVNVEMPRSGADPDQWYQLLRTGILESLAQTGICKRRVILSGQLPGNNSWVEYQRLMEELELADSSIGFCELEEDCLSLDPSNELFALTDQGQSASRIDRILVPRTAKVAESRRILVEPSKQSRYGKPYGLSRLTASRHYGWLANVRLAQCSQP